MKVTFELDTETDGLETVYQMLEAGATRGILDDIDNHMRQVLKYEDISPEKHEAILSIRDKLHELMAEARERQ